MKKKNCIHNYIRIIGVQTNVGGGHGGRRIAYLGFTYTLQTKTELKKKGCEIFVYRCEFYRRTKCGCVIREFPGYFEHNCSFGSTTMMKEHVHLKKKKKKKQTNQRKIFPGRKQPIFPGLRIPSRSNHLIPLPPPPPPRSLPSNQLCPIDFKSPENDIRHSIHFEINLADPYEVSSPYMTNLFIKYSGISMENVQWNIKVLLHGACTNGVNNRVSICPKIDRIEVNPQFLKVFLNFQGYNLIGSINVTVSIFLLNGVCTAEASNVFTCNPSNSPLNNTDQRIGLKRKSRKLIDDESEIVTPNLELVIPATGSVDGGESVFVFFRASRALLMERLNRGFPLISGVRFGLNSARRYSGIILSNDPKFGHVKEHVFEKYIRENKREIAGLCESCEAFFHVFTPPSQFAGVVDVSFLFLGEEVKKESGFRYEDGEDVGLKEFQENLNKIKEEEEEKEKLDPMIFTTEFGLFEEVLAGIREDRVDELGSNVLYYCIARGRLDLVKHFIEKRGFNIDIRDRMDMTPTDVARYFKQQKIIEYLEERKRKQIMKNRRKEVHHKISLGSLKLKCSVCEAAVEIKEDNKYVDHKCKGKSRTRNHEMVPLSSFSIYHMVNGKELISSKKKNKHKHRSSSLLETGKCENESCGLTVSPNDVKLAVFGRRSITIIS